MAMCNSFHRLSFLWFCILCLCQNSSLVSGTTRDYFDARLSLVEYLTNNSETVKEILPAQDNNTPVNVKVRITLHQIADVDEKNQVIQLTVWLRLDWNNPFLTWDPAEYGGIESIHANHDLFWVPDVALFNEASLEEILYERLATKLIINKNGDCTWNVPTTFLSRCKINVARFPFDEQECHVSIGSWTYSGRKINMTYFERHADMSHFIKNGQWEVESVLLHNRVKYYGPNNLPFPDVTLTLKIKRRSLYYRVYIVVPSAVISLLAPLSFILPSENGERISLLNGILVANSVYMLMVSSVLPETSDAIPILGIYLLGNIITIVLCLCATCVSLKCHDLTCPMRTGLWKFFQYIANLKKDFANCIFQEEMSKEAIPYGVNNKRCTTAQEEAKSEESNTGNIRIKREKTGEAFLLGEINEATTSEQEEGPTPRPKSEESNTEYMKSSKKEQFAKQWKTASKVLDTVFLIIFFLTYIGLGVWFYTV